MKKLTIYLMAPLLFLFACEAENISEEPEIIGVSAKTKKWNSSSKPKVKKVCKVLNADRCDLPGYSEAVFWWPNEGESGPQGLFSVNDEYKMKFVKYDNGDINLVGKTELNGCVVDLDVWFINPKDLISWLAGGGEFKQELEYGSCSDVNPEDLLYYIVDDSRSSMIASGCGERDGSYTIEHRPSNFTYAIQVGSGGALFDSGNDFGISGWAYAVSPEGEKDILDFNLVLECKNKGECETAFARGDDGNTCFIGEGFSRWGWTIGPLVEGDYIYDIYAGAGKCDINKGELVGTVDISYLNGDVTFDYDIDDMYEVNKIHEYAGKGKFPTNKKGEPVVAPGQYTITENLSGEIYVIFHAEVCKE